jgi:hypothetical protein
VSFLFWLSDLECLVKEHWNRHKSPFICWPFCLSLLCCDIKVTSHLFKCCVSWYIPTSNHFLIVPD